MSQRLDLPVHCAVATQDALGESPVWSAAEQALFWVDITGARVQRWHPASGARQHWAMPCAVGSIGLRARGGLVVALRSGLHLLDTASGALQFITHPEAHLSGNRFNDGKVAPDGRFWAGTMDDAPEKQPVAALYRLDGEQAGYRCVRVAEGLRVSNGLAWSPDGRTMYHSDSRAATIWRYAYDPANGEASAREVFVTMQPEWGRPDGAVIDEEGCYWSCGVTAGRLNRFSPRGELIAWVPLPVTHPTMPCFGGANGRRLFITTIGEGMTGQPLAGSVLELDVGVAGPAGALYAG